jgi:uncharacterized delta-60 repeat protein
MHRRGAVQLAGLLATYLSTLPGGRALAKPGDRDAAFGTGGTIEQQADRVIVLPDGRFLLAGHASGVLRYEADGTVDATFSSIPSSTFFPVIDIALQADGRIVSGAGNHVARYEADGALDTTFGGSGVVFLDPFTIAAVLVQSDGKIVAAGQSLTGTFELARLDAGGALDASFGTGGYVTGTETGAIATLGQQPDGKLVAAGPLDGTVGVVRYEVDGGLDATFGSSGIVSTAVPPGPPGVEAMLLEPDGHIVVGGPSRDGGSAAASDFLLLRYDSGGALDAGFGAGGIVMTDLSGGGPDALHALALEADGKILAAGSEGQTSRFARELAIVRYDPQGTLDPTFGLGGHVSIARPLVGDVRALAIQSDGRVIAASTGVASSGPTVRLLGGTCGDGVVDAGEDCDDGNLATGDGCDASCCNADVDGDGRCDAIDPCTGPGPVASARLTIARSRYASSDAYTLVFKGDAMLPVALLPGVDVLTNGVRLLVEDSVGRNVVDLTIAGGAYVDPPQVGWKLKTSSLHRKWVWVDKAHTYPEGFYSVVVEDRSGSVPGLVRFTAKARPSTYYSVLTANPPLAGLLVLDPPVAQSGLCAEASFPGPSPAPACTFNASGGKLTCR